MKTAVQYLNAADRVFKIQQDYRFVGVDYERRVGLITEAKNLAAEFGLDQSIYLANCTPEEYFLGLERLLGRAAVDAVE